MEAATEFVVESPDVVYSPETIEAQYEYRTTSVSREGGVLKVGEGPSGGPQGWGSCSADLRSQHQIQAPRLDEGARVCSFAQAGSRPGPACSPGRPASAETCLVG